jgi:hypothetical protein
MKIDEIMKEIKLACEYTGVSASDNAILESATAIFISDKNPITLGKEFDEKKNMREFLKEYKEFLLHNSASQREYNARISVVNDIKLYLDGHFKSMTEI